MTYTTSLTGNGSNTYDSIAVAIPKFSGPYTLLSAVISSTITTNVQLTFTNTNSSSVGFTPGVSRTDFITLGGNYLTSGNNNYNYHFTFLGAAGASNDHITYVSSNIFDHLQLFDDSITTTDPDLNQFIGTGAVSLNYNSTTSLTSALAVVPTPMVSDHITFSVTYYYCDPTVLSSNILTFTAVRDNTNTVALNWITTNEEAGRRYEIELSHDGKQFGTLGSQSSDAVNTDASYQYNYTIAQSDAGKLYFRLLQVESNGKTSYSPVRIINLEADATPGLSIYPNPPSDFINLVLPVSTGMSGSGDGWQIDVIAADGSLVQRNFYANTNTIRVNFARKLAAGTYFVRASDPQTGDHYTGSFLMQH